MGGIGCSLGPLWTGLHSCFSPGHHEWLLGPEVDILPFLLLPLAGPEDFSEEVDLGYDLNDKDMTV